MVTPMTKHQFKTILRKILSPAVSALSAWGVSPMLVTLFGLVLALYGAMVVAEGKLALGAVFLLLSGFCDVLDGDIARRRGVASRFGGFLDSTLDRVGEFAYFGGILYYAINRPGGASPYVFCVVMVALAASILTSYARARAEGLGYACTVGIMERSERVGLLALGLLLGYTALVVILTILAITSVYTVIQRIIHVYRVSRVDDRGAETAGDAEGLGGADAGGRTAKP